MYNKYMLTNGLQLAAEGWQIISQNPEARIGARRLLLRLADVLELTSLGMVYNDEKTGYSWTEKVERRVTSIRVSHPQESRIHPFPTGSSYWFTEGYQGDLKELHILLNLLAEQWLHHERINTTMKNGRYLLKGRVSAAAVNPSWIAVSRSTRDICSKLPELSFSTRPLLLLGENGSGKRYLAALIHNNGPNPSESFTEAEFNEDSGTLYIPDWQSVKEAERKIILRDKRRVIAGAVPGKEAASLQEQWCKRTGDQRSIITVPALREHSEDIPMLAGRFLEKSIINTCLKLPEISPTALEALIAYSWPGNIRELKETISWSLEKFDGIRIRIGDLPPAVRGTLALPQNFSYPEKLAAREYEIIKEELFRQKGSISRTARTLGLSTRQISWRAKKYGIDPREFKLQQR